MKAWRGQKMRYEKNPRVNYRGPVLKRHNIREEGPCREILN